MLKSKKTLLIAFGIAALGAGGAGAAYGALAEPDEAAETRDDRAEQNEARVLASARISLAQAVQTAETRTGLKASEAGIDDEGGGPYFEVSVGHGAQEQTVLVDTQSGQVAGVRADTDQEEAEDD